MNKLFTLGFFVVSAASAMSQQSMFTNVQRNMLGSGVADTPIQVVANPTGKFEVLMQCGGGGFVPHGEVVAFDRDGYKSWQTLMSDQGQGSGFVNHIAVGPNNETVVVGSLGASAFATKLNGAGARQWQYNQLLSKNYASFNHAAIDANGRIGLAGRDNSFATATILGTNKSVLGVFTDYSYLEGYYGAFNKANNYWMLGKGTSNPLAPCIVTMTPNGNYGIRGSFGTSHDQNIKGMAVDPFGGCAFMTSGLDGNMLRVISENGQNVHDVYISPMKNEEFTIDQCDIDLADGSMTIAGPRTNLLDGYTRPCVMKYDMDGARIWMKELVIPAGKEFTYFKKLKRDIRGEVFAMMGMKTGSTPTDVAVAKISVVGGLRHITYISGDAGERIDPVDFAIQPASGNVMVLGISTPNGQNRAAFRAIVKQAPFAVADGYLMPKNTTLTSPFTVTKNDREWQGSLASLVTQPEVGTINLKSNGTFTYTPPTDFVGKVTFKYRLTKPGLSTADGQVTIQVLQP